jgi:hypothetical protein
MFGHSEDYWWGAVVAVIIFGVLIWLSLAVAGNFGGAAGCIFFLAAWLLGVPAVLFGPRYISEWLDENTNGRFGCGEIGCLAVIVIIVAIATKYFGIW